MPSVPVEPLPSRLRIATPTAPAATQPSFDVISPAAATYHALLRVSIRDRWPPGSHNDASVVVGCVRVNAHSTHERANKHHSDERFAVGIDFRLLGRSVMGMLMIGRSRWLKHAQMTVVSRCDMRCRPVATRKSVKIARFTTKRTRLTMAPEYRGGAQSVMQQCGNILPNPVGLFSKTT